MRPPRLSSAALSLVFAVLLGACEAGKLYRQGRSFEEANQDVRAAELYLDALDLKPTQKRANTALAAMAEGTWNKLLQVAQEREAAASFPEALASYQRLLTLTQRLDSHDLLTFKTIDVAERVEAMANAAADERYQSGQHAVAAGRWAGAVKGYSEALSFKADYKDSTQKLAFSYYSWGGEALSRSAWREAAEHYGDASKTLPTYQDSAAQAARIYAALGRDFKERGSCRQAVRDLRQAQGYAADPKVATDLDAALACATSRVSVDVFGNPSHVTPGGLAVGDLLTELLVTAIPSGATEFVKAEATGPSTLRRLSAWPGPVYAVSGKLMQVKVIDPRPSGEEQAAEVQQRVPCAPGAGDPAALCVVPARVDYVLRRSRPSVSLDVSLVVTDMRSGAPVLSDHFSAVAADDVRWAEGLTQAGRPAVVSESDDAPGLILPPELIELLSAPRTVRAPDALARAALDEIAGGIATRLRQVVDAEPKATDPTTLKLP